MKTERELYNGLRSALDEHEKLPFSQIRTAALEARRQVPTGKDPAQTKPFFIRRARPLAYAAACLILITGVAFFFLSDASRLRNEPAIFDEIYGLSAEISLSEPVEEVADDCSPETGYSAATAADSLDGTDNAADVAPKAAEEVVYNLSKELKALLQQYADQPDHKFSVVVISPEELRKRNSDTNSVEVQYLTAEEIYTLVAQDYFLDVVRSASSAS